jgi:hypothetical protein
LSGAEPLLDRSGPESGARWGTPTRLWPAMKGHFSRWLFVFVTVVLTGAVVILPRVDTALRNLPAAAKGSHREPLIATQERAQKGSAQRWPHRRSWR